MVRVYPLGSKARGDNFDGSDYDFCILTPDDYGLFEVGRFYADLRYVIGIEMDVVCEDYIHDDFSREFLRTGGCSIKHDFENINGILEYCGGILAIRNLYGDGIEVNGGSAVPMEHSVWHPADWRGCEETLLGIPG